MMSTKLASSQGLGKTTYGPVASASRKINSFQWKRSNANGLQAKICRRVTMGASRRSVVGVRAAAAAEDPDFNVNTIMEKSRPYRRDVFDGPRWVRHRSMNRYWRHIESMTGSRVLLGLLLPTSFFAGLAGAVCVLNHFYPGSVLPASPFSLSGGFLSLLLVFRTNSSYDRWWEARKIWGGLLNRSRDFVRQGLTWFAVEDEALKAQLQRYTAAFAVALKVHLRYDEDMRTELTPILLPHELEEALKEVHVPNHLLRVMSAIVKGAELDPIQTAQMDMNITDFEDALGKCERIFKTPIPLSYTRMTSRFLIFWLAFLPFALYKDVGLLCVPVEGVIALFLLGIKDIGIEIEEPFSILSCEAICGSVAANTKAMLETQARDRALVVPRGSDPLTIESLKEAVDA